MTDRDKVIKGLECCADWQRGSMYRFCEVCPYNDNPVMGTCDNLFPLFRDALALLRSDQAQLLEQRKRLETIADIAYDYDGYKMEGDLKALIDEMRDIALGNVPEEGGEDGQD